MLRALTWWMMWRAVGGTLVFGCAPCPEEIRTFVLSDAQVLRVTEGTGSPTRMDAMSCATRSALALTAGQILTAACLDQFSSFQVARSPGGSCRATLGPCAGTEVCS